MSTIQEDRAWLTKHNIIEFISFIRDEPLLFYKDSELSGAIVRKVEDIWKRKAHQFNFESGERAKETWKQLVADYTVFLRHGGDFRFATEMQFMQGFLLNAYQPDVTQSESELDECELQEVLNSDEEDVDVSPSSFTAKPGKERKITLIDETAAVNKVSKKSAVASVDMTAAPTLPSFNNLSSLELIFLGYAKVLQRMPLTLQLQTKRKITEIMDEAEIKSFEMK